MATTKRFKLKKQISSVAEPEPVSGAGGSVIKLPPGSPGAHNYELRITNYGSAPDLYYFTKDLR